MDDMDDSQQKELAKIVDDTVTDVYVETPEGWKCERKGCTTAVYHRHTTYSSLYN